MADERGLPSAGRDRGVVWVVAVGAAAGAAALYFISNERGRRWLRELPEMGRGWAAAVREGMALVREIAGQIEQSVDTFEQALGRVEQSITTHAGPAATAPRNGGERA